MFTLVLRDGGEPGQSGYVNRSPILFRRCALSSSDVYEPLLALSDLSATQVAEQLSWSFFESVCGGGGRWGVGGGGGGGGCWGDECHCF